MSVSFLRIDDRMIHESIRQQRQLLPDHKRSNPDEEDLSG